jgi:hypothetical protein
MKEIKNSPNTIEFDFDQWMKLAEQDPEAFEKKRRDITQATIKQAPMKMHQRLNGMQWRIDNEIKLAANPMDGCLKVYRMMMDSVYEPGGLLEALTMTDNVDKSDTNKNVIQLKSDLKSNTIKK